MSGDSGQIAKRQKAITLSKQRFSVEEIARRLSVSRSTVYAWLKRYREERDKGLKSLSRSGQGAKIDKAQAASLFCSLASSDRLLTWKDIVSECQEHLKITVSRATVIRLLTASGIYRKVPSFSKMPTDSVEHARAKQIQHLRPFAKRVGAKIYILHKAVLRDSQLFQGVTEPPLFAITATALTGQFWFRLTKTRHSRKQVSDFLGLLTRLGSNYIVVVPKGEHHVVEPVWYFDHRLAEVLVYEDFSHDLGIDHGRHAKEWVEEHEPPEY